MKFCPIIGVMPHSFAGRPRAPCAGLLAGDLLKDRLASTGAGLTPLPPPLTRRPVKEAVNGTRVAVMGGLPRSAGRSSAWHPDARCRLPLSEGARKTKTRRAGHRMSRARTRISSSWASVKVRCW
jgi:hypothetical protein